MPRYKLTDTNGKSFVYNSDVALEDLPEEERDKRVNRARLEASVFGKQLEPRVNPLEPVKNPLQEARAPAYLAAGTIAGAAGPAITGAMTGSPAGLPGMAVGGAVGGAMSLLPFILEKLKGKEYEPTAGDIAMNAIPIPLVDKGGIIPRGEGLLGGIMKRLKGAAIGAGTGAVEGAATGVGGNAIDAATGEGEFKPLEAATQGAKIGGVVGGVTGPFRVQSAKELRGEQLKDLAGQEAKLEQTKQARVTREGELTTQNRSKIEEIDSKIADLSVQEEALKSRIKKMRALGSDRIPQLDDKEIQLETQLEATQKRMSELEVVKGRLTGEVEGKQAKVDTSREELKDLEGEIGKIEEKKVKAKTESQVPSNRTLKDEVNWIKGLDLDTLLGDSENLPYFKQLQKETRSEEASVAKFRTALQQEMGNGKEFDRLMQGRVDEKTSNAAKLREGSLSAEQINYQTKLKPLKEQLAKDEDLLALSQRELGGASSAYDEQMKDLLKTTTALEILKKKKDKTGDWDKKVAELEQRQVDLKSSLQKEKNKKNYIDEDTKKELDLFDQELADLTTQVKGMRDKLKPEETNLGLMNRKLWGTRLLIGDIPGLQKFSNAVKLLVVGQELHAATPSFVSPLMRKAQKVAKQIILEQAPLGSEGSED